MESAPMDASLAGRLRPGDHVCWTYADDAERRRIAVTYVRAGLRDHHKVVYCAGDQGSDRALADLVAEGIDVTSALHAGRLDVQAPHPGHLTRRFWGAAVRQAHREGYAGLRALGDMAWASAKNLDWYEQQLNRVFSDGYGMAVCLYDRRRCAEDTLARVGRAHPCTVSAGRACEEPRLRMVRSGATLKLTGEADLSNRDALATLLDHLLEDAGPGRTLTVDLADLRFADASTCRLLVDTAREAAGRITYRAARPRVLRLLSLLGG
jgi:anti-anti-sigma regulatory factor